MALSYAQAASETAGITLLLDHNALFGVAALYSILGFVRDDLDQLLRAGRGAFAAGNALLTVNDRYAVDDMDGVEFTGLDALTKAKASLQVLGPT